MYPVFKYYIDCISFAATKTFKNFSDSVYIQEADDLFTCNLVYCLVHYIMNIAVTLEILFFLNNIYAHPYLICMQKINCSFLWKF